MGRTRASLLGGDEHCHAPRAVASTARHADTQLVLGVCSQALERRRRRRHVHVAVSAAARPLTAAHRVHGGRRRVTGRSRRRTGRPAQPQRRRRQRPSDDADRRHQRRDRLHACNDPHTHARQQYNYTTTMSAR